MKTKTTITLMKIENKQNIEIEKFDFKSYNIYIHNYCLYSNDLNNEKMNAIVKCEFEKRINDFEKRILTHINLNDTFETMIFVDNSSYYMIVKIERVETNETYILNINIDVKNIESKNICMINNNLNELFNFLIHIRDDKSQILNKTIVELLYVFILNNHESILNNDELTHHEIHHDNFTYYIEISLIKYKLNDIHIMIT